MTKKKTTLLIAVSLIILLTTCAKFVPPTGGEKDIIPPKLVSSVPKDKTKNYKGNRITLVFNELVDSKSLKQELIITPEPKSNYKVKNKGEVVELDFENKLDSNTTYTLNFAGGIKDLNEQNKTQNLKLVFSTGNEIDSLGIAGEVKSLFTKKELLGITVGIYSTTKKDSLPLLKQKPTYFTKTDSSGKFKFENLKSDKYRIIAFEDENNNLKFDNKKEQFGFRSDTLVLTQNLVNKNLIAFPYDTIAPKYKRYNQKENEYSLRFDEDIYRAAVVFDKISDSLIYKVEKDEIKFFNTIALIDSLGIKVIFSDSLLNTDTLTHKLFFKPKTENIKTKKTTQQTLKIAVKPAPKSLILPKEGYVFSFDYPLIKLDTSKIKVRDDTLKVLNFDFELKNQLELSIKPKGEVTSKLVVKIEQGAFVDMNEDSNSVIEIENSLLKINETGVLAGRVGDSNISGSFIFQLLEAETRKLIKELNEGKSTFLFEYVLPNSYVIRVIEDKNKNGIWDTGNFAKWQQPENIYLLKEPVKVKANFEFRDIIIPID